MDVYTSPWTWTFSVALIASLLLFDFVFHVRKAHIPTLREATIWTSIYVGIAVLFGVAILVLRGTDAGTEYFAGYVTEKALSVDNVFVFLVLMTSFKVPREDQQKVLLFGIVIALIARTGFIFLGAALISSFAWVFYIFGLILLVTAGNLLKPEELNEDRADNFVVRMARKLFHTTHYYDGDKLFTVKDGKRALTPMLLVMVAIGGTDILFALDSIPAIFGLTQDVFIVFTATAFSLLGLRQLYFLIDGLLERLLYLSYGLALILGFIGAKLILHALHENNLPFVNDGEPVPVIEISTGTSLIVIVVILLVTVLVSLHSPKGKTKTAVTALRRDVAAYLELDRSADAGEREKRYACVVESERKVRALDPQLRQLIREPEKLEAELARVHALQGSEKKPSVELTSTAARRWMKSRLVRVKNDHAHDAALQQTTGKLWRCPSPRRAAVTGGPMRNSEQSRYLAMLVGGLVMGLSVIFAALYTALNRPSAF